MERGMYVELEMGKYPNPARTNRTRTRFCQESNRTRTQMSYGSYSVLSLNEIVGTFHSKRGIITLLRLTKYKYQPNDN